MIGMKDQCFGVEVEFTGITREQAAKALASHFGTTRRHSRDPYDSWYVLDTDGKEWRFMSDASIRGEKWTEEGYENVNSEGYWVEMVSPKLTYAELPKFQECVRQMRRAKGKVNSSCGIHIHVDAANHNRQSLKNLLSIMFSKEDILFKALQVNPDRVKRYCKKCGSLCCKGPASFLLRRQRTLRSWRTFGMKAAQTAGRCTSGKACGSAGREIAGSRPKYQTEKRQGHHNSSVAVDRR